MGPVGKSGEPGARGERGFSGKLVGIIYCYY